MIDELGYFDDGKKNKQTNDWMNKQTNDYDYDDKNDYYWWGLMTLDERWDEMSEWENLEYKHTHKMFVFKLCFQRKESQEKKRSWHLKFFFKFSILQ